MRRSASAVAAGAAAVLLAGVAVLALRGADTTTSYDERTAVEAFRSSGGPSESTAASASAAAASLSPTPSPSPRSSGATSPGASDAPDASAPPAPAPAPAPSAAGSGGRETAPTGVYRYATQGHEEVDALGGARHDYPATTTVTYSRKDCGSEERWQPLEERVGVTRTCPGAGGEEVRATVQEREFFGQRQTQTYRCDPGLVVRPADPRPGQSWTGRCLSDDSTVTLVSRVVALEELEVDGTRVPVVRITIKGTATGSVRGRADREVWLARADGLLVQATGDTDTDADTAGGTVRYRETYRLRLQSLSPAR